MTNKEPQFFFVVDKEFSTRRDHASTIEMFYCSAAFVKHFLALNFSLDSIFFY
jgi:hypothetical protein